MDKCWLPPSMCDGDWEITAFSFKGSCWSFMSFNGLSTDTAVKAESNKCIEHQRNPDVSNSLADVTFHESSRWLAYEDQVL